MFFFGSVLIENYLKVGSFVLNSIGNTIVIKFKLIQEKSKKTNLRRLDR